MKQSSCDLLSPTSSSLKKYGSLRTPRVGSLVLHHRTRSQPRLINKPARKDSASRVPSRATTTIAREIETESDAREVTAYGCWLEVCSVRQTGTSSIHGSLREAGNRSHSPTDKRTKNIWRGRHVVAWRRTDSSSTRENTRASLCGLQHAPLTQSQ